MKKQKKGNGMYKAEFEFNFGDLVEDKVTGLQGIVLARSEYSTGCHHYGLSPARGTAEGKDPDWLWFDATRLRLVSCQAVSLRAYGAAPTGGPFPNAPKQ